MAKLSAYGQKELFRVAMERMRPPEQDPFCSWERVERAVMHNHRILERRIVIFRPPDARRYVYGWSVAGKVKPGMIEIYREALLRGGWELVQATR